MDENPIRRNLFLFEETAWRFCLKARTEFVQCQ
jgi:hypothetical protein